MEAPCSRFTAAEGGARLASVAGMKNTLAVEYASFISTRMIYEHAYKIRGSLFDGQQRSVYVSRATRVDVVAYELTILTDLKICKAFKYDDVYDWYAELDVKEVLVCTSEVLKQILEEDILNMPNINVLILDSCHLVSQDANLQYIMKQYKECEENVRPRILALTYPLFSTPKKDDADNKNAENGDDNAETGDNLSKSEDNLSTSEEIVANGEENIATSEQIRPKSKENLPTLEQNLPISEQNLKTSEENQPTPEQNLSKTQENIPASEESLPISEKNLPTVQNRPTSDQNLPTSGQNLKTSEQNLPISEQNLPISEENLPTSEQYLPTSEQNLPKPEENLLTSEENLPTSEQNLPTSEENLQTLEQNLLKTEETLLNIEEKLSLQKETTITTEELEITRKNQINVEPLGVYENLDDFEMYEKLEWKIEQLEKALCCQMDLAEDIDGGKRLSATLAKPKELIIEYSAQPSAEKLPEEYLELESYMKDTVYHAMVFLDEHRYDPTEIYGEDLYEEFKNIPDPTIEPKYIFKQFLYVLEQLGPYAADKAAFSLLTKLEKLKIKVPYERHFLLLCLCTSVFVKIRCQAELIFSKYDSDWEKIKIFCTPKVLRFAEILEKFCPPDQIKEIGKNIANLQNCDGNIDNNKVVEGNTIGKNNENIKLVEENNTKIADNILVGENDIVKNNDNEKSVETEDTIKNNDNSCVKTEDNDDINKSVEDNDTVKNTDNNCDKINDDNKNKMHKTNAMLESIERCDFKTLSNKIEDRVNTYEANLKDLDDFTVINYDNNTVNIKNECHEGEINQADDNSSSNNVNSESNNIENSDNNNIENSDNTTVNNDNKNESNDTKMTNPSQQDSVNILGFPRRTGHRTRGRGRPQRSNQARNMQMAANPDALCGIVFMKEPLVAKIMFMIIVDMSRANPKLSYLCAQYCAVEKPADPGTELRECQRQGKKQEDVLKKFRMHECNLLLATSALEEGIDLPRCNLVLRWDVPNSYRSYGLCRSRARAARASCAVLSSAEGSQTDVLLHNVAVYRELDQLISRKCGCGIQDEPPQSEEDHADSLAYLVKPYTPFETNKTANSNEKNKSNNTENISVNSNKAKNSDNNQISNENNDDNTKTENITNSNNTENTTVNSNKAKNSDNNQISNENNDDNTKTENITNSNNTENTTVNSNESKNNDNQISNENNDDNTKTENITNSNNKNKHSNTENENANSENSNSNKNSSEHNKITTKADIKTNSCYKNKNTNADNTSANKENSDNNKNNSENNNARDVVNPISNINSDKNNENNNLICNKCNNERKSVSTECPCVLSDRSVNINSDHEVSIKIKNKNDDAIASVDLNSAIALINRYCGKLPSDTFTRLAPQWWMEEVELPVNRSQETRTAYICTLRLPLNCPLKYNIVGHPMPTKVLARRMVALQACRILHKSGELDNQLMPIGKENFEAGELDCNCVEASGGNETGRPGTTKRRQYYFKRTASVFTNCQPIVDTSDSEIDPPKGQNSTNELYTRPTDEMNKGHIGASGVKTGPNDQMDKGHIDASELKIEPNDEMNKGHIGASEINTDPNVQLNKGRIGTSGVKTEPNVQLNKGHIGESELNTEPNDQMNKGHIGVSGIKTESKVQTETVDAPGKKRNMLYAIVSKLWCALPERYNTRGRRLHVPQNASQAIGILMAREQPENLQIPAFPVYTRSGEVRVSVEYVPDADVRMSPRRGRLVRRFMRFVFTEVLRVRRRGMNLQSEGSTQNNYYIVPTIKTTREDGTTKINIDWGFLELIYQHTEEKKHSEIERPSLWQNDEEEEDFPSTGTATEKEKKPGEVKKMENPLLKVGETFLFSAEKYREAVVTPWYRNQDQPQFFLVAEICWNLSPDSAFPSATHTTFRQYYKDKYGVSLTQTDQPLLDVDHTSNRLNLLTPRYVNRKGVALPVSSERTRRAKRDRLDQKQILVPELCRVHPFAAPLWFATVALPCVLYRINALLIADEIRRAVAIDVGLGIPRIDETTCPGFQWTPLDFGWSLSEVLNADAEKSKDEKKREEEGRKEEIDRENEEKYHQTEKVEDGSPEEWKEKTINDILQEKESAESGFEIGTWSNEMASSIPQNIDYDEFMEPLPANLTFCTSASGGVNWCDPVEKPKREFQPSSKYSMADSDCSYMSSDFDTDDSELNSEASDEDTDTSGFCSSKNSNAAMGVRIEYKTAHEAEAVDLEHTTKVSPAPQPDDADDALDRRRHEELIKEGKAPKEYIEKFHQSVSEHRKEIIEKGLLIKQDEPLVEILPETTKESHDKLARNLLECKSETRSIEVGITKDNENMKPDANLELTEIPNESSKVNLKADEAKTKLINEIFPYGNTGLELLDENGQICLENIEKNKRVLLAQLKKSLPKKEIKKLNCFSMKDVDIDSPSYVNEKVVNVGFDTKKTYVPKVNEWKQSGEYTPYYLENKSHGKDFDFDYQPKLEGHPGPSPSVILQALTMSNANDGINLERLETIGDSFLKFAITAYLYCAHPTVHEGKLSHMRSKQVSNLNLYRLGRNKRLGARMIASKFEPHDNWLPPCHKPPSTLHPREHDNNEHSNPNQDMTPMDSAGCFIPYNLITQHSIPDKSIADCVEALIGAYLLECGPRGALLFMSWLGIRVLPKHEVPLSEDHPYVRKANENSDTLEKPQQEPSPSSRQHQTDTDSECSDDEEHPWQHQDESAPSVDWSWPGRPVGSLRPHQDDQGKWHQTIFGELKAPPSPLLRYIKDPEGELEQMLSGYDALERTLQYRFKDRSLLLQALTHASHQQNRLTDCYQRLEFLGDAILDYLITRHLYEDPRRHSPGALTDLRSALVNNTIFATLAARHGFHKYFRHMAPGLNEVLTKYVRIQEENGHSISEEHYLIQEDAMEQAEDVEVPKALGDLFESVAGAVFLDSGMSLGAVWKSYVNLMGAELEAFSAAAPKSPVRELLEAEPDTAKFGKPERLADGRRVRVCVEVFGRGAFKGIGRNYRIAKGTAARCALRHLKGHRQR